MPISGDIPVQTILRMVLDKSSADDVRRFLDDHEKSWSAVDKYVKSVGDSVEKITRYGMGMLGVAGVGAIAQNFFATSQAGSNVALSAGRVTGGTGVWHPYGQAMLGDQFKTGVAAGEISQGLIQAIQSVGGRPTPTQAAILGGLLAGYGQTTGMTPSQVAQVVAPLLQASNQPLTFNSTLGMLASMSGNLTAFPGSQAAPMLGLLSQLGVQQAIGSGPAGGFTFDTHGMAATVNAAARTNSIWRSPGLTGAAINSVSGSLQNAYGNPSQEAFFQMAGISYEEQRQGFTPQTMQKIMSAATRLYGTGTTRDIFLRSMFGLQGADLLEQFAPGGRGARNLQHDLQHHASPAQLRNQLQHPQARTTPNALSNRASGGILHWLESSPLHAAAGLAGLWGGKELLSKGISSLFSGGAEGLGAVGGDLLGAIALGAVGGLGGGLASALIMPDSTNFPHGSAGTAVKGVIAAAQKKFGSSFGNKASQQWMWNQFGFRYNQFDHGVGIGGHMAGTPARTSWWDMATGYGENPKGATQAQQLLEKVFSQLGGPNDPIQTLNQAATKLLQYANKLTGPHAQGSAYHPGSGTAQGVSLLGTPGVQALGAMAPGMEFAALTGSGGATGGLLAAYTTPGGGAPSNTTPAAGGGWQACTLTWYDPALGGINSSNGAANPNSAMANGQPYSASGMTCAAPPNYPFGTQIAFSWGGKTVTCTVTDRGGAIQGNHFDLARAPATRLGIVGPGRVTAKFKVLSSGKSPSSNAPSGGTATGAPAVTSDAMFGPAGSAGFAAAAGSAATPAGSSRPGGVVQPVNVHIYNDGSLTRKHRILRGHKP